MFHGTPDIISLYTKCASAQWLKNTAGDAAFFLPLSICPLVWPLFWVREPNLPAEGAVLQKVCFPVACQTRMRRTTVYLGKPTFTFDNDELLVPAKRSTSECDTVASQLLTFGGIRCVLTSFLVCFRWTPLLEHYESKQAVNNTVSRHKQKWTDTQEAKQYSISLLWPGELIILKVK